MRLFGPLHLSLLAAIAGACILLSWIARRRKDTSTMRIALGWGIAVNELIWWVFRYSHEGVHLVNLPLQLCDATVWMSVLACLTLSGPIVEFAYFAGMAGAGMALITPDLWSPWPSYPAIYFFVAHGAILAASSMLVFGGIAPLRRGAVWRAYAILLGYAAAVGAFDAATGANYMYLRQKPHNASLLDALGPWPLYLLPAAAVALAGFWLLWIPARKAA
ncbi:MAG TPA: TIGR02206 family membrane protein [Candidatus Limnocylindrales bacterium]|nr:TIGR02206 family membrane protein [Candidatus Limnocylindrales bacterium]